MSFRLFIWSEEIKVSLIKLWLCQHRFKSIEYIYWIYKQNSSNWLTWLVHDENYIYISGLIDFKIIIIL